MSTASPLPAAGPSFIVHVAVLVAAILVWPIKKLLAVRAPKA